jgi:tRNA pseudouridine38-40 synthase
VVCVNIYKIVVAYEGTAYHGWQIQPTAPTVCQALTEAFSLAFFQPVSILGASRTDKGVHALGQVAIAQTPLSLDEKTLMRVWNKMLPQEVVIQSVQKLDHLVHPHDGVLQKTYAYYFFTKRPLPFAQRYGWFIHKPIDFDLLQEALKVFVGTHDFRSFCTGDDLDDTVRTIDSIKLSFVPGWNAYRIEFKGHSFLRYMIRRIVGACLQVALKQGTSLQEMVRILELRNPCHTLPNAPAKGLVLERIEYQVLGEMLNNEDQNSCH